MDFPENPYMQILHHAAPVGIVRTADIASVKSRTRNAVSPAHSAAAVRR